MSGEFEGKASTGLKPNFVPLDMGSVGPISVKLINLMKNSLILVTKHCKKKKKRETHEKEGITISFFPVAGFFFITPWTTETTSTKAKKKKKRT